MYRGRRGNFRADLFCFWGYCCKLATNPDEKQLHLAAPPKASAEKSLQNMLSYVLALFHGNFVIKLFNMLF